MVENIEATELEGMVVPIKGKVLRFLEGAEADEYTKAFFSKEAKDLRERIGRQYERLNEGLFPCIVMASLGEDRVTGIVEIVCSENSFGENTKEAVLALARATAKIHWTESRGYSDYEASGINM